VVADPVVGRGVQAELFRPMIRAGEPGRQGVRAERGCPKAPGFLLESALGQPYNPKALRTTSAVDWTPAPRLM
jgi:hypothetical protein